MTTEVLFHPSALAEADAHACNPGHLAWLIRDALDRRLDQTAGSRLKILRRTGSNAERRLRTARLRTVFSLIRGTEQKQYAFVHAVQPRDKVYARESFQARISAFHARIWDAKDKKLLVNLGETGYEPRSPKGDCSPEDCSAALLEKFLTDNQFNFVQYLSPLTKSRGGDDPFLVIGHGPPGSGKTWVAEEIVINAVEEGHSALVLVPSIELKRAYQDFFESVGHKAVEPWTPRHYGPAIMLADVREFFGRYAGETASAPVRRLRVKTWLRAIVEDVGLRCALELDASKTRDMQRWADLLDTLVGDERWLRWSLNKPIAQGDQDFDPQIDDKRLPRDTQWYNLALNRRDDIDTHNRDAYEALQRVLGSANLRGRLLDLMRSANALTRAEAARQATLSLDACGDAPLVVLVDECQDLAPAEWRRLVDWCMLRDAERQRSGGIEKLTRLVLVGDLNQRINVTPFSWGPLKTYAHVIGEIPKERIVEEQIEKASFRCRREIAQAARVALDKRVFQHEGGRLQALPDPSVLQEGGTVEVLVALPDVDRLLAWIKAACGEARDLETLIVLGHEDFIERVREETIARVQAFTPSEVKGLEFERVVVVHPLTGLRPGQGLLSIEEATALYTLITRARSGLLCILSQKEWERIEAASDLWKTSNARIQYGDRQDVVGSAAELLKRWLVQLSADDQLELHRRQFFSLIEDSELEPGEWTRRILAEVRDLVLLGDVNLLCEELPARFLERPDAAMALRASVQEGWLATMDPVGTEWQCLRLVALGEFATARRLIQHTPKLHPKVKDLDQWLEIASAESGWQTWAFDAGGDLPLNDSETAAVVARAWRQIIGDLSGVAIRC